MIAESAVRRVEEGTSAVLLQSGLNESWWADSMECYTYLRNIQDLLSDGKTPYERRFGETFLEGPIIPFGSLVEYYLISAKDQSRIHQFGKKVLPGLVLGYALYAVKIWKGDVLVADIEALETRDASEIYLKKDTMQRKYSFPRRMEHLFSSRRWTNKICWTRSGTENFHFHMGSPNSRRRSKRLSWRIRRVSIVHHFKTHIRMPVKREMIFGPCQEIFYRHHVDPRVKFYSPREESFPILLKYIDVSRTTHTNLDVMQESRIDFYWNIDGSRDLSDSWTGFTQFTLSSEKLPDGYVWSWESDKTAAYIQARSFMVRTLENNGKEC